jgi:V8-like Glu-specific endopeptidase
MVNDGCTGWFIGDGLYVTAAHCLKDTGLQDIKFSDGQILKAGIRYLRTGNAQGLRSSPVDGLR